MKTFGKYQLLDEIGSGPAGTTYKARDTFRDGEFALKVLRSAALPASKKQFCGELAACAELRHPNIVKVHDLGEVDGAIYIATELLAGADLRRSLQESAPRPLAQKLKLIAQICDGLAFAHRNGIAHGNIKPSNIFISEAREARILDFGIARWPLPAATADAPPARLPNYLSPEQILDRSFDSRSDLFSVGILLYELVAGVYPFQVPAGLIPRAIIHTEPERIRKRNPQIPEGLERLLVQALDKDPQRRLQSADEFAVMLYAVARQIESEPAVPASAVSPAPESGSNPETPLPPGAALEPARLAASAAVTAAATGSSNPKLGAATAAAPQSTRVESAPSPSAAVVAPVPATAQAAASPDPVAPPATLVNLINGAEKERQAAALVPSPKRLALVLAGAAIGILILAALLERQSTNATPDKVQSQANPPASALPSAKQSQPSPPAALEIQKPPAVEEAAEPQPRPEQILNGRVASLWEAGQYVQAMKLVDAILADDPSQAQARAWKTKIRAAQDAEAAIK
jgi:eukaryotic-like serine/threonine-protein kinase